MELYFVIFRHSNIFIYFLKLGRSVNFIYLWHVDASGKKVGMWTV